MSTKPTKVLVTGGAGFIGSALVRFLLEQPGVSVLNLDKLTYASSPEALSSAEGNSDYFFAQVDICDPAAVRSEMLNFDPDLVFHLAAESHVDRSIEHAAPFITTNVLGTYNLLDAFTALRERRDNATRDLMRFVHVSTDEVYGSLPPGAFFSERSPYQPSSPYSASKAGADHLVRAWWKTYGVPTIVTNCSNNYGPYQFPEKFVPTVIVKALREESIPIYGDGCQERDWIYVEDHVRALWCVARAGVPGETYLIGTGEPCSNWSLAELLCDLVDEVAGAGTRPRRALMRPVADRPGHDRRYAIDASTIKAELGWFPETSLLDGMRATVQWYLNNRGWWERILSTSYRGERLGLGRKGGSG